MNNIPVSNLTNCFYGRNNSNTLNIYVPKNSTTLNSVINTTASSFLGISVSWVNSMASTNCYYNSYYNIYIYPVNNVREFYE